MLDKLLNVLAGGLTPAPAAVGAVRHHVGARLRPVGRPGRMLMAGAGDDEGDTVTVQRRRPAGQESGPRERAEAPHRRQDESGADSGGADAGGGGGSGGFFGGSGGGASSGSGSSGGLPSFGMAGKKGGCGGLLLVALLVVALLVIQALSKGGQQDTTDVQPVATVVPAPQQETPTAAPALAAEVPSATPRRTGGKATATAAVAGAPQGTPAAAGQSTGSNARKKWTVLLYLDADDKVLDQDMYFDLNEAERAGSSADVNVVAQIERYKSKGQGSNPIVGGKRFYVTHDEDLSRVNSQVVGDLGPIDMSDTKTLVDFATWAIQQYPADKYALVLSDHGMGWPGGWTDASSPKRKAPAVPIASVGGNQMYLMQIEQALADIRSRTGLDKFEMIGMDACLMSQLEVYSALAPHARYAVASEETEPALGWAYTSWLGALVQNPGMSGAEVGRQIVSSYITKDERVVDDQARADYMRQGSPLGGLFQGLGSPDSEQLAEELGDSITLTAIDLGAMPQLMESFNTFANALQGARQKDVAKARTYAQSFTSIFGEDVQPSYIDLGNFAALVAKGAGSSDITQAATALQKSIKSAVLAEKHGPKKPGATGIAIYFPNSELYRSAVAGPQSYTVVADRFSKESVWDDFLAFHYTGRKFRLEAPTVAAPERSAAITAPGAGQITVSPVRVSAKSVVPGKSITMQADVAGDNVGYVYFFTGYLDKAANAINVADTDYLESPQTREVDGVYYPDWGERSKFTLRFAWEPLMFSISDGQTSAQVLLEPVSYGAKPEQAVYTVDGTYTFADGGETQSARLYFSNGLLRQVLGFAGDATSSAAAPAEIVPQSGDRFTVTEKWLDLDASGQVKQVSAQPGKTLTFGTTTFTWKQLDAAAGDYVVGFLVDDMDGNRTQSYAQVTVK